MKLCWPKIQQSPLKCVLFCCQTWSKQTTAPPCFALNAPRLHTDRGPFFVASHFLFNSFVFSSGNMRFRIAKTGARNSPGIRAVHLEKEQRERWGNNFDGLGIRRY